MNKFEVDLSPQARKYYKKAPRPVTRALDDCFRQLENNPFYLAGKDYSDISLVICALYIGLMLKSEW